MSKSKITFFVDFLFMLDLSMSSMCLDALALPFVYSGFLGVGAAADFFPGLDSCPGGPRLCPV